MNKLPNIYHCLLNSKNLSADDVLLGALNDLEQHYRMHALKVLLKRRSDHAVSQLVDAYHLMPDDCRRELEENASRLEGILRDKQKATDEQTRINVIDMISHSRSYVMAYLLSEMLRCTSSHVRGRAANTLRDLTVEFMASASSSGDDAYQPRTLRKSYQRMSGYLSQKPYVLAALQEALQSYDTHHRTSALDAILLMSTELKDALNAEAEKPFSKCWKAILDKLQNEPRPGHATFTFVALGTEAMRFPVAKIISHCTNTEFMTTLCAHSWMIGDPDIRKGCQSVKQLDWLMHEPSPLLKLEACQFRQVLRLLSATNIREELRVQWYRTILLSDRKDLHKDATFALLDIHTESANELLRLLADWADEALTGVIERELRRRLPNEDIVTRPKPTHQATQPDTRRPDPAVPLTKDFHSYWSAFKQLDDQQRKAEGLEMLQTSPDALERIQEHLSSSQHEDRVQAIQIIRCMRLGRHFTELLMSCSQHPHRMVRSASVKALGQLGADVSERVLIMALSDSDRRVRANAIEALDEIESKHCTKKLIPKLKDPDHRIRAATIQTLLKLKIREAAEALIELLNEDSQPHRVSALWVIDRLKLFGISERIAKMADQDPDPTVRRRARRLLRRAKRQNRTHDVPIPPPPEEKSV